jgi:endonuclease YncB( thermonuclease family)
MMRRVLAHIALLATLVLPAPAAAAEYAGRIVGVIDGDTVELLTSTRELHRVRLSGIDAPESRQPFGQVAKQALSSLVFNRQVLVSTEKKDRNGRLVGKVLVAGQDANLQMVRRGYAWHFKRYEREQSPEDRRRYSAAEQEARAAHRGLWSDVRPVAPWDFRARRRE